MKQKNLTAQLLVFFSFISCLHFYSQTDTGKVFSVGIRAHYSYMFVHAKDLLPDDDYFPRGLDLDLNWTLISQDAWDQCNCYPKTGLLLSFFDYDKPSVLGYGYVASWFIEPTFRSYNRLSFSTRGAVGLAYLTRPYDSITNPFNQAYSMHLSGYLLLNLGLTWRVNEFWRWNFSFNINHNSNGGLKDPNKGLNFPSLSLGTNYTFRPVVLAKKKKSGINREDKRKIKKEALIFYSNRAISHGEKKRHHIFGVSFSAGKRISRVSGLSAGAEFFVDYALKEKLQRKGYGERDYKRVGILLGHEFLMGRFSFSQQIGVYLYNPAGFSDWYFKYHDAIYQRYGLKYRIGKRLLLGVDLKVDRYIANFVDFRAGVYF